MEHSERTAATAADAPVDVIREASPSTRESETVAESRSSKKRIESRPPTRGNRTKDKSFTIAGRHLKLAVLGAEKDRRK